jgi:hypothetical protein
MGCDIHLHVEIKVKGRWLHYNNPSISRDYWLFCLMAGVRQYKDQGEPEPISSPRGFPADASETTKFDYLYDGGDAHSTSWLSSKEAGEVQEWHQRTRTKNISPPLFGYLFGNYIDSYLKCPSDGERLAEMGYEDARVVFWFDN